MVRRPEPQGAPQVRRRAADEPQGRARRLHQAGEGGAADNQGQHTGRDPQDTRDLRPARFDAVQAHHQLDGRPGFPQDGRERARPLVQLPLLRLPLPAQRRERQLAGRGGLRRAVLRFLQEEEPREGRLLRRLRTLELLPRHPSPLQHQEPLHRARVLRHPVRGRREGVRQPPHLHHPEHHSGAQLLHTLRPLRRQRNTRAREHRQQDLRGPDQLSGQEVHDARGLHLQHGIPR